MKLIRKVWWNIVKHEMKVMLDNGIDKDHKHYLRLYRLSRLKLYQLNKG